jgi:nicotinamidase-related amidase
MDLQAEIVAMFSDIGVGLIERVASVIAAARNADVPVIYIVVGFRPGYPEIAPRNPMFAAVAQANRFRSTAAPGADIVPTVAPRDGDIVVVKHRISAFAGTDLEMILRAKGIDTLVLCGLATSGVVLSTVRHAGDADYRIVVVRDGCGDRDDEVHRVLMDKVFARQTTVMPASEMIAAFEKS